MAKDKRDLLQVLTRELQFVEKGGYRAPSWKPPLVFEDSPTCLNYNVREHRTPCSECVLMHLVPLERKKEEFPCTFIPITESGQTIDDFYRSGTQEELEQALRGWLKRTITRLKE